MSGTTKLHFLSSSSARSKWGERWQTLRDLLGGALVLVVWLALWTSVWAAVAGPLSPVATAPSRSAAVSSTATASAGGM